MSDLVALRELCELFKREWSILRRAPLTTVLLVLLSAGVTLGGTAWFYSRRLAERDDRIAIRTALLAAKADQLSRYRVALGLDNATPHELVGLSHAEMKAKALNTASQLREMCLSHTRRIEQLGRSLAAQGINAKIRDARMLQLVKEDSDEFDRRLKSDTFNVDNELRRRLGPKAVAAMAGVSPSVFSASDNAGVNIVGLLPSGTGMSIGFVCALTEGMEQMARLLPTQ